ncbi:MAG: hypothetical protein SGILL_002352 [Bacillariaceae sp.]
MWLNDTLGGTASDSTFRTPTGSSKTYRHSLSGERKLHLSPPLGKSDHTVDGTAPPKTPRTPRAKTSALADAFLKKIGNTPEQAAKRKVPKAPVMKRIKPLKDRWPPQTKSEEEWAADNEDVDASHQVAIEIAPLLDTFETGKQFRQTTGLSPKAIKEAASNRAKEESMLHNGSVKKRQASFESIDEKKKPLIEQRRSQDDPFVDGRPAYDDLPSVASSARAKQRKSRRLRHRYDDDDDDDSTLSSHQEAFRSSYKIQYLGERQWDIGRGDASALPPLVQRFAEPENMDSVGCVSYDSSLCPSKQGRFNASNSRDRPLSRRDRRFESSATLDCAPADRQLTDRRFDAASSAALPPIPARSRDPSYIPTVWQTRENKKWRLKRVWEHKQDKSVVVDEDEPEYLVDESDLESALNSLLGVPSKIYLDSFKSFDQDTVITSSASSFSELEACDFVQNRWGGSDGNKDPSLKQPWRIQRVWDRDGEICHVEDERSVDDMELLDAFNDDDPDNDSFFSADDYSASSFNEDEFLASLDVLSTDGDQTEGSRDLDLIRRKIQKVEKWIGKLAAEEGGDVEKRQKMLQQLQKKCVQYLNELSRNLAKINDEHGDMPACLPRKVSVEVTDLDETEHDESSSNDEEDTDSKCSKDQRDAMLVAKKLQKTENLMHRMITDKTSGSKDEKLFHRLEEKRSGYIEEMGLDFYPLEITDRMDPDANSCSDLTVTTSSMHSEQADTKFLDMILEDENSKHAVEEELRDPILLKRKIRKVEKEQQKILALKGKKKSKSDKLFRRLEEKRVQYRKELEGVSPIKAARSPSRARRSLRRRVEQAIEMMEVTIEETGEEESNEVTGVSPLTPSASSVADKESNLACQHVGKWSSPLNHSSRNASSTEGEDLKMTIHSLESVYMK